MLDLTAEFIADVGRWRRFLSEGDVTGGESTVATFYCLVKQPHTRTWFSYASLGFIGGLSFGVYWRYPLTKKERRKTIPSA